MRVCIVGIVETVSKRTDKDSGEIRTSLTVKDPFFKTSLRVSGVPFAFLDKKEGDAVSLWADIGLMNPSNGQPFMFCKFAAEYTGDEVQRAIQAAKVLAG